MRNKMMKLSNITRLVALSMWFAAFQLGSRPMPILARQAAGVAPQQAQPDLSTPEKTIETFIAAIKQGDIGTAAKCVVNGKPFQPPGAAHPSGPRIMLSQASYKTEADRS